MPVPSYDLLMLPVLKLCAKREWGMGELIARIADDLHLTQAEREERIPSGSLTVVASRVHWAKFYLKKAGFLDQPKRGCVRLAAQGRTLLKESPTAIDRTVLQQSADFRAFQNRKSGAAVPSVPPVAAAHPEPAPLSTFPETPDDQIAAASREIDDSLRDALLQRVLERTPAFFERLILDLLLAMGYGGSRADAGERLGGTGDGGVDGLIREDHLGLDRVYLQAKRYQPGNVVGPEPVRAFVGALVGRGAQKGVFITTSTFSKAARDVANLSGQLRVVLIDGDELTRLMVRFGVGVRVARTIEIKRVDIAYFEDAEPE